MCGIACYLGGNKSEGLKFAGKAAALLEHRGPDDKGIYSGDEVTLIHRRLSILDLSQSGHQPMVSSCGRYMIIFNGEIYNHLELRKKYLSAHNFIGHSDTETIVELFRLQQEKMLTEMVGMWSIIIWDSQAKNIFISRDRYGQKPLYHRRTKDAWMLSSEMKPLLDDNAINNYEATAVIEYLSLGNYGHLGVHSFFKDIYQFPQGGYAWLSENDSIIPVKKYWQLPEIKDSDKVPFDARTKKELHDRIVEAVLSQTLSDVPIGITLSGGIDSSVIAGILSAYYDNGINIFTAQSPDSKYDETKYVNDVITRNTNNNFIVHRNNLSKLSIQEDLPKYIRIQEEPFGDPSIIAHGFLMNMAADAGVKVVLNGQGADELFFGYNNMAQAILSKQMRGMQFNKFYTNLNQMKLGKRYMMRSLLESFMPGLEYNLRIRSRTNRRNILQDDMLKQIDDSLISLHKYNNTYNVWKESIYGVHIPHLVHYDDRNGMSCSIEGRMPFLDHRVAECVATLQTDDFLKNGLRKYILRESCRQYLPDSVYNRTDKIGFHTPLIQALSSDKQWVAGQVKDNKLLRQAHTDLLLQRLGSGAINTNDALQIWRCLSVILWKKEFNVAG